MAERRLPVLVSHTTGIDGSCAGQAFICLVPTLAPNRTLSLGAKGDCCLRGCFHVWRDEGFEAETQDSAVPEEHISFPGTGGSEAAVGHGFLTPLFLWDLAFLFSPSWAQEGQRAGV